MKKHHVPFVFLRFHWKESLRNPRSEWLIHLLECSPLILIKCAEFYPQFPLVDVCWLHFEQLEFAFQLQVRVWQKNRTEV